MLSVIIQVIHLINDKILFIQDTLFPFHLFFFPPTDSQVSLYHSNSSTLNSFLDFCNRSVYISVSLLGHVPRIPSHIDRAGPLLFLRSHRLRLSHSSLLFCSSLCLALALGNPGTSDGTLVENDCHLSVVVGLYKKGGDASQSH